MRNRFIDLSVAFEDRPTSPPNHRPTIEYTDHHASLDSFSRAFGGVRREDLPDGAAWAVERVSLNSHAGTHMDAPWHFHRPPTTGTCPAESRRRRSIRCRSTSASGRG